MKRRLFNLLAVISLVLCAATVVLWVRSYWVKDELEWVSKYRQRYACSTYGRILVQISTASGGNEFRPLRWDCHSYLSYEPGLRCPWRFAGFWVGNRSATVVESGELIAYTYVVIPLYAAVLVMLILPAIVIPKVMRHRRHGPCLCAKCGYDLRATPERCPECGAVPDVGDGRRAELS